MAGCEGRREECRPLAPAGRPCSGAEWRRQRQHAPTLPWGSHSPPQHRTAAHRCEKLPETPLKCTRERVKVLGGNSLLIDLGQLLSYIPPCCPASFCARSARFPSVACLPVSFSVISILSLFAATCSFPESVQGGARALCSQVEVECVCLCVLVACPYHLPPLCLSLNQ